MAWMAGMSSGVAGRTCTSSPRIIGLLPIEDPLQRSEVRTSVGRRVGQDHAVGLAHDFGADCAQLAAGRACEHLKPAGPLQVVHEVERLGYRRADYDHAMVGEEH